MDEKKTATGAAASKAPAPPQSMQELASLDELERDLAASLNVSAEPQQRPAPAAVSLEELEKQILAAPVRKTPPPPGLAQAPMPLARPPGFPQQAPGRPAHPAYMPRMQPPPNPMQVPSAPRRVVSRRSRL
eukprot:scaffold6180_cov200-Pinguiococcus_pyrenoidosus.AAC.10